jgi:hypothetical protein
VKTSAEFFIGTECLGSIGYDGCPERVDAPKVITPEKFRAWVKGRFSGRVDYSSRPCQDRYAGTRYIYTLTPAGVKVVSVDVVPQKTGRAKR